MRPLLGPVGALKVVSELLNDVSEPRNVAAAGPLGGDLGAVGRIGERSFGVDLADSCSLCLCVGPKGERSLRCIGERIASRVATCVRACRLG